MARINLYSNCSLMVNFPMHHVGLIVSRLISPKSHMGWPKYIFMNLIRCSLSVTFPRKTAISFFSVNFFLSRTKIKCLILLSFIITPFPLFSVIRRLFEMDGIGGTKSTSPAHRFNRSCWENQRV